MFLYLEITTDLLFYKKQIKIYKTIDKKHV